MVERFDVVVVGARCAGAPLATFLARAGMRVCVVDRARLPQDTASTHGIQPTGVKVLGELGVMGSLLEVARPIERGTVVFDDVQIELDGVSDLVGAPMLNVRRITLDAVLVEAAEAAGAEIRPQTAVTDLIWEHGRVTGVRTAAGDVHAPLVVGADGVRSAVARLVDAPEYHRAPSGRVFIWAYHEGVAADRDRVWVGQRGDMGYLASSTDAGLFMAAVAPSVERRDEILADRDGVYAEALAGWPDLGGQVAAGSRVGPIRVMSNMCGYFRTSAGPGWALVGDAGHFKDPSPGQGIADALRQSATLAKAIERGAAGGDMDGMLRDWWEWRDRDAWEMYWFATDMGASGAAAPLTAAITREVAADPRLTEGLLRVLNHDVPPSEVFTPALALRAAVRGLATRRGERGALLREMGGMIVAQVRRDRAARRVPSRRT
ncbi:MAG TPA: NAD(P)/FAD-dependent oxidoreductase [Thermoleophilaceae bacterium]|nr:NAD(P)/FAD-dependent oxidoreductase [Thermoleophilaceae bacterium]